METVTQPAPQRIGNFSVVFCDPPKRMRGRPNVYASFFMKIVGEYEGQWARFVGRTSKSKAQARARSLYATFRNQQKKGLIPVNARMRTKVGEQNGHWYVWFQVNTV